jgi:putative Mg2+ transporter-C (MgtC) family protein
MLANMPLISGDLEKLMLAAVLGGVIGLEREAKHRPAGIRTNMFICMGAAMFTLLSDQLAVLHMGDHTRIAAQIIPGIGFIGAGCILHARADLVTGITTASTLFVVASIGMAVGGDLYWVAILSTLLAIGILVLLGGTENFLNLKMTVHAYEISAPTAQQATAEVNQALEPLHLFPSNVQTAPTPTHVRVRFECEGTHKQQKAVLRMLRESGKFESVTPLGPVQTE